MEPRRISMAGMVLTATLSLACTDSDDRSGSAGAPGAPDANSDAAGDVVAELADDADFWETAADTNSAEGAGQSDATPVDWQALYCEEMIASYKLCSPNSSAACLAALTALCPAMAAQQSDFFLAAQDSCFQAYPQGVCDSNFTNCSNAALEQPTLSPTQDAFLTKYCYWCDQGGSIEACKRQGKTIIMLSDAEIEKIESACPGPTSTLTWDQCVELTACWEQNSPLGKTPPPTECKNG